MVSATLKALCNLPVNKEEEQMLYGYAQAASDFVSNDNDGHTWSKDPNGDGWWVQEDIDSQEEF